MHGVDLHIRYANQPDNNIGEAGNLAGQALARPILILSYHNTIIVQP